MLINPEIANYTNHYDTLPMSAYEITLKLVNSVISYDNLHLDGLLSYCVVNEATQGKGLLKSAEPYEIPLPLAKAWQADNGVVLWQSTDFVPIDDEVYSLFWAKKAVRPELLKRSKGSYANLLTNKGADKEMLIPMPAHTATSWVATFVGNAIEVARLLGNLGGIGKKRVMGHGVIHSWAIKQIDKFSWVNDDNVLLRNLPIRSLKKFPLTNLTMPMGWSPPYWLTTTYEPCLPFGSNYGLS